MPSLSSGGTKEIETPGIGTDPSELVVALGALRARLYRRALMLTGQADTADDLVQEAVVKALTARVAFWSRHRCRCLAEFDHAERLPGRVPEEQELAALGSDPAESPPQQPPDDLWLDLLSFADVEVSVTALASSDREIFRLAYVEGLGNREIAHHLGLLEVTVGTRLFRFRARLRGLLEDLVARRLETLAGGKSWLFHHGHGS